MPGFDGVYPIVIIVLEIGELQKSQFLGFPIRSWPIWYDEPGSELTHYEKNERENPVNDIYEFRPF